MALQSGNSEGNAEVPMFWRKRDYRFTFGTAGDLQRIPAAEVLDLLWTISGISTKGLLSKHQAICRDPGLQSLRKISGISTRSVAIFLRLDRHLWIYWQLSLAQWRIDAV
jgi:hypothetical protein